MEETMDMNVVRTLRPIIIQDIYRAQTTFLSIGLHSYLFINTHAKLRFIYICTLRVRFQKICLHAQLFNPLKYYYC